MPSFDSKVRISADGLSNNIVLADIDNIKGAFKIYTSADAESTSPNYFSDGQIIYLSDSGSLYRANVTLANPPISFTDSVSFSQFSFDSGSFVSASFDSSSSTLTLFGQDINGSTRVSSSIDLSSLSGGGGGGSGDITAVFAGDGLTGGASSGNATLEVDAGNGISLTGGVSVDTGSAHFVGGVQKITIDGGNI